VTTRAFRFTVDNQLLGELGERLVAKNYIALAELIKNAYDADAERVTVTLNTSAPGGGEIVVADVGQGMTAEEVERYWMRVATDNKVREPRSAKYGRYKSGSKGIGRFACRRLAKELELTSVAAIGDTFEVTKVSFHWKMLAAGQDLAQQTFAGEVAQVAKAATGLTLRLTGLTERWTQRDFNVLRRSLVDVSIARPEHRKGFKPDPGFTILLASDEFSAEDATLSEQYLNAGWGRVRSDVSESGSVTLALRAKRLGSRTFELSEAFNHCVGVELDLAWIPGTKEYWRNPEVMTNAVRLQLEETEGGVKVYCDGFRVYPYGESGTDWLDISRTLARRAGPVDEVFRRTATKLGVDPTRALLSHPKETTLVGKVVIPPQSAGGFVIKMDREGFVENEAFSQLKRLVQLALQWMTVQYVHFTQLLAEEHLTEEAQAHPALEQGLRRIDETRTPQDALDAAVAIVEKAGKQGIDAVPGRERTLSTAASVIRRSANVMDARLAKLQILASTGPIVFAFAHEIKSLISRLATHANGIDAIAQTLDGKTRDRLVAVAQDLRDTRSRLDHEVQLFGTFARSLAEDAPARQAVNDVVKEVASGFSYLADSFGITIDTSGVEERAKTPAMRSAEIYSVLVNLISNAVKSCIASGGKKIGVTAGRDEKGMVLRVADTGVGLDEGYWDRAFEPLVADPQNKIYRQLDRMLKDEDLRALGKGSGLGLSIVRDIVISRGGRVRFTKARPPWRACVEVQLP
jgi:signal transduction histidine kinase